MGKRSGGPNIAQVDEKIIRGTPVATRTSRRFNPLATLLRKYFDGFRIDSPTSALAAKCMTASGFEVRSVDLILAASLRLPSKKAARESIALRWPSLRSSKIAT